MIFILVSPFVSLMGNVNTSSCLSSTIVLMGCEGLSPYVSSSNILTCSPKRASKVLVDREGGSQLANMGYMLIEVVVFGRNFLLLFLILSGINERKRKSNKEKGNTYFDTSLATIPKSDGPQYYNNNVVTPKGLNINCQLGVCTNLTRANTICVATNISFSY